MLSIYVYPPSSISKREGAKAQEACILWGEEPKACESIQWEGGKMSVKLAYIFHGRPLGCNIWVTTLLGDLFNILTFSSEGLDSLEDELLLHTEQPIRFLTNGEFKVFDSTVSLQFWWLVLLITSYPPLTLFFGKYLDDRPLLLLRTDGCIWKWRSECN